MTAAFDVTCSGPAATQSVAAALAPLLRSGDVILLDGDLGAGKTTFTQGLARALGVNEVVTSPTFTLVRSYHTSRGFELLHVDVYRLERLSDVVDLALPEFLDDGAVAVIEWGDKAARALQPGHLQIRFALTDDDAERRLTFEAEGSAWEHRIEEVRVAVAAAGGHPSPPALRV
ncbi:MAG TPA: tRNA (adenosine(37)-N6)-threonylcarbamoyltransferase complex ATPase subunit type 1 TsaE [Acidimicrobiales bacterium]|nr:tRNA (adenosine(37)-N6)-threonylcarbamoyltransferase complex ATPase subunit type 1 TsaE [Acidimicrobiales bacterium]